jgi:hypothetical protein
MKHPVQDFHSPFPAIQPQPLAIPSWIENRVVLFRHSPSLYFEIDLIHKAGLEMVAEADESRMVYGGSQVSLHR